MGPRMENSEGKGKGDWGEIWCYPIMASAAGEMLLGFVGCGGDGKSVDLKHDMSRTKHVRTA